MSDGKAKCTRETGVRVVVAAKDRAGSGRILLTLFAACAAAAFLSLMRMYTSRCPRYIRGDVWR